MPPAKQIPFGNLFLHGFRDQQPGAVKYTFTVIHPYKANSSAAAVGGPIGPLQIASAAQQ
jgi:hypothetical protein